VVEKIMEQCSVGGFRSLIQRGTAILVRIVFSPHDNETPMKNLMITTYANKCDRFSDN
jgi:hypothetical protein